MESNVQTATIDLVWRARVNAILSPNFTVNKPRQASQILKHCSKQVVQLSAKNNG